MILYNFCEFVTAQAVVRTRDNTKHIYKINFATAVNICRAYLKHSSDEIETMLLIQKPLTPVRSNRKYPIRLRPKRNRDFMYHHYYTSFSDRSAICLFGIRNCILCSSQVVIWGGRQDFPLNIIFLN